MDALMVFLGLGLRLALPLLVTALLAWGLRRLDARWEREALARRPAQPALATPCWVTRQCPPVCRLSCPAYAQPQVPCWQLFRDAQGRLKVGCLECVVLRSAPTPAV